MSDDKAPDVDDTATDADAESQNDDAEAEIDGLSDGDFIRLAYTARTVEGDQLVDTTDREVAEDEGVDVEQQNIEPRVIALGAGHLFETVEADIEGKEAGDTGSVVVPAEEAFGEYDADEVRTVSSDKLDEDDRYPGAHVDIDGQHGHVETVIGGRARVDFNHPLAGEDVEYEYEIVEEIEDRVDRAKGMLSMFVDADLEMWVETDEVEEETLVEPEEGEEAPDDDEDADAEPETEIEVVEKETLYIEATPQLTMNQQWMFQKQQIAQDLMDRLDLDRVIIQETIDGGGMMGGLGGMMGGMGGMGGGDVEEALADADVDADEIVDELEGELDAEELEDI